MSDGTPAPTTAPTTDPQGASTGRPLSLLASETFGHAYTGEVKREQPETKPDAPEAPAEPAGEREAPEPAETAPEGETAPEEPEKGAEGSEGEAEEPISSLSELIQHYEWDQEWLNGIKVPVKVNGEASEATFKDLVDGYQMRQAAEQLLDDSKTKAKTITEEAKKRAAEIDVQFSVAGKLIEQAETLLSDDVSNINWQKLRADDPAEYAARKEEIKERRERIDTMKREAVEQYQASIEKQKVEAQANLAQRVKAEQAVLLEKLPEWQDVEKAKAGKAKLAEYLLGQGFAREDVLGASDHRLILIAEKARRYDEMKSSSDVASKRVAKVPKVMKPGAPKPQEQLNKEQRAKQLDRLKKSGSIDDAYALLVGKGK